MKTISVLFVCLGNICRSPTAEAVFRERLLRASLSARVSVDSAGTAAWHVGKPPDSRAVAAGARRGYDLSGLRARQVGREDFLRFDHVFAMDRDNLAHLRTLQPAQGGARLALLLDMLPQHEGKQVPDPYYGGDDGFEQVLDLMEHAADAWISRWQRELS